MRAFEEGLARVSVFFFFKGFRVPRVARARDVALAGKPPWRVCGGGVFKEFEVVRGRGVFKAVVLKRQFVVYLRMFQICVLAIHVARRGARKSGPGSGPGAMR